MEDTDETQTWIIVPFIPISTRVLSKEVTVSLLFVCHTVAPSNDDIPMLASRLVISIN